MYVNTQLKKRKGLKMKEEKIIKKVMKKDYLESEHFQLLCECAKAYKSKEKLFLDKQYHGLLKQLVNNDVISFSIDDESNIQILEFFVKNKYLFENNQPKEKNVKKFNELVKKDYKLFKKERPITKEEQLLLNFFN